MFETLIKCPVCDAVMLRFEHPNPILDPYRTAVLANPAREDHARKSIECAEDMLWVVGWNLETKKIGGKKCPKEETTAASDTP